VAEKKEKYSSYLDEVLGAVDNMDFSKEEILENGYDFSNHPVHTECDNLFEALNKHKIDISDMKTSEGDRVYDLLGGWLKGV